MRASREAEDQRRERPSARARARTTRQRSVRAPLAARRPPSVVWWQEACARISPRCARCALQMRVFAYAP